MGQWYSKELGDGVDAFQPTSDIQNAYMAQAAGIHLPNDAAVFSRYDLRANVVTVYFSPPLASLAKLFGAQPCPKPVNNDAFGMLVGNQLAWQLLFGNGGVQ